MHCNPFSIFMFLLAYIHVYGYIVYANIKDLQSDVAEGGENGNPGVKVRITQRGINYLNDVLKRQMSVIVPRIRIDNVKSTRAFGTITLTNGRVTDYKAPDSQSLTLQPPDRIILTMKNMNIAVHGHVKADLRMLSKEGDFDGRAEKVDVTFVVKLLKQQSDQFGVKTESCQATVDHCTVDLYNMGAVSAAIQTLKGAMENILRRRLARRICSQGTHYFDESVNNELASRPTKIWLNGTKSEKVFRPDHDSGGGTSEENSRREGRKERRHERRREKGKGERRRDSEEAKDDPLPPDKKTLEGNISKDLMLDYSNLRKPTVTETYVETYNKGEVSYRGQGGTPFYPTDLHDPLPYPMERMLYVVASDYVANSMLYQSFKHGLLKYNLRAEDAPNLAPYLKTSCAADMLFDVCLGSLIPQIQKTFPNSEVEIQLEASKVAPALFFQKDGLVRIQAPVTITLFARKGNDRKVMTVSDADVTALAKLYVEAQRMKGNASIEKMNTNIRTNNIKEFGEKDSKEFTALAKTLLEMMANSNLKKGLPLPVLKAMKLTRTTVKIYERTMRVDSDFEMDNAVLSQMAAKTIRENSPGVRVEGISEDDSD